MRNKLKWQNYKNSRLTIINFDDEKIYSYLQLLTRTGLRVWLEWRKNIYHVLFLNLNWHFNPHFTKVTPELFKNQQHMPINCVHATEMKNFAAHQHLKIKTNQAKTKKSERARNELFPHKNRTIMKTRETKVNRGASCLS